jgi:membrane protein
LPSRVLVEKLMTSASNARTPLWLDLLVITGLTALAYKFGPLSLNGSGPKPIGAAKPNEAAAESGETCPGDDSDPTAGAIGARPSQEPEHVQRERAAEAGRGREAESVTEIPAKGWKDILVRVYTQFQNDRLLAVAAGVVFYMLLALFPALAALVSIYGLFTDPSTINEHLSLLEGVMPVSAIGLIRDQITALTGTSSNALSLGFILGLGVALWSANAGMKAIIDALNVVYDEREKRSFIWLTVVAFAFTLGGLAFIILALSAIVVMPLVFAWLGLESRMAQIISLARWPALFIVVLLWLAVLYRYGPSRTLARWQWLTVGSVLATVLWLAGSALFSWYLSEFANYDATYGSLGAGVGLMMWLWLSVIVILLGGELNAEIEHQTALDTTVRPDKPLGRRGAVMADTVGERA